MRQFVLFITFLFFNTINYNINNGRAWKQTGLGTTAVAAAAQAIRVDCNKKSNRLSLITKKKKNVTKQILYTLPRYYFFKIKLKKKNCFLKVTLLSECITSTGDRG